MYRYSHKIMHVICLSSALLVQCHSIKSSQPDRELETELSRFTQPTIKQMIGVLEESITDLANTVTLQGNQIDARLTDIEEKLDLLLSIVEHQ